MKDQCRWILRHPIVGADDWSPIPSVWSDFVLFFFVVFRVSFSRAIAVALYPAGPSGAYSPDGGGMGYMMDGGAAAAAAMMHRPPADPMAFHSEYHYPPQYYGHL